MRPPVHVPLPLPSGRACPRKPGGYYLDGKLGELDFENEWYYDSVSNKVYLSPPGGVDPNTLLVEGMCMENGILMDWDKTDMLIEGMAFEHQYDAAIKLIYVDGVVIRDCVFRHCEEIGVQLGWATTNVTVECNVFEDMLNYAIEEIPSGPAGPGVTIIQSNVIRRTAMVPGYGRSGSCESSAIRLIGTDIIVRRNVIEDVGHVGIVAYGAGHICEENIIRRAQLLLDDAGSIDLNGPGHVVRRNLIFDTLGNRDISNGESETGWVHGQMGFSIFTQPRATNCVIEQNTCANNLGGILVDSSTNVVVRSNVVYNTTSPYMPYHLNMMTYSGPSGLGDRVTDNIFYSLASTQLMVNTTGDYEPGLMDRNYYCNPYGPVIFDQNYTNYTLAEWRAMHPARDANSITSNVAFPADAVTNIPSDNSRLFVNTNDSPRSFSLDGNTYEDLDGVEVTGNIVLNPFTSTILVLKSVGSATGGADRVLIQAGDGGTSGYWGLDTNSAPQTWSQISGPVSGWALRDIEGDNVLLQRTDGSWTIIWHLNPTTGAAESYSSVYNRGSAWSWRARSLDGDRILLQNGDGGAVGFWTVDGSWAPVGYSAVAGAVPGWIARSIQGDNVLLQKTDGSWTIIWHLNPATGQAQSYSSVYNRGSAWSWVARDLEGDRILLQAGDGGVSGFWTVDGGWAPVSYTPIYGSLPGWRVLAIDAE